jgi:hypothetical protein
MTRFLVSDTEAALRVLCCVPSEGRQFDSGRARHFISFQGLRQKSRFFTRTERPQPCYHTPQSSGVGMAARKSALRYFASMNRLSIPVSTGPGPTMLARTPVRATSIAANSVSPSIACLLAT